MEQLFFTIENKTNLHVGSGISNYGVIDQLVQRDPVLQFPVIHSSSLKGGIKEFCHHDNFGQMVQVFGSEKNQNGKTNNNSSQTGGYKFFDANLLAMPVRCDKQAFIHITCPQALELLVQFLPETDRLNTDLVEFMKCFDDNADVKGYCFLEKLHGAVVEDYDITACFDPGKADKMTDKLKELFKYDVVLLKNEYFSKLTNDLHLPVVARNHLENGESKNLWYEQVVPRCSLFWSLVFFQQEEILFESTLAKENTLVQIGANGSIGYGYCSISKLN